MSGLFRVEPIRRSLKPEDISFAHIAMYKGER